MSQLSPINRPAKIIIYLTACREDVLARGDSPIGDRAARCRDGSEIRPNGHPAVVFDKYILFSDLGLSREIHVSIQRLACVLGHGRTVVDQRHIEGVVKESF